jgi:NAD(P)-dependent dehydrogenase (short-subunit alcohol dehydrogenase family)
VSQSLPVAIVTGASGGLGPGIAEALANAGAVVVLTARNAERLEASARRLGQVAAGQVIALASDARDATSVRQLAAAVLDRFGRIDVLVNAAASSTPLGGAIESVDVDALMADVDTKVGGYLRYSQAVVPAMKASGAGRIVNIGGLTGRSSDTLSGLRNAAVSHLTKVLSDELGPFGIAVNAVHPGIVRTPHLDELFEQMAAERGVSASEVEADFVKQIPAREILAPAEVGRVVAFLAQIETHSINGQSISVDGGYSRGIFL